MDCRDCGRKTADPYLVNEYRNNLSQPLCRDCYEDRVRRNNREEQPIGWKVLARDGSLTTEER